MNVRRTLALALGGYLLGSISFARLVGRRVAAGADLTQNPLNLPGDATIDYGGVSATSIAIRGGPGWGVFTGLLDMAKAFVPTLLAKRRWPDDPAYLVVAVATMVGHNYPIYHRFKGGRGQTPMYGALLAIDWRSVPVTTTAGTFLGVVVFRDMFVAYTLGMYLLVPWFIWRAGPPHVAYAVAANALYAIATIPETKRYLELRKAGKLQQIASFRDLVKAHPAMRGDQTPEQAPGSGAGGG